jgi:hypothetical protein
MSITLAVGTAVAIASTYGTSVTMTAITNAAEAVATLAAGHACAVGDYLEVTSGWDLLNSRIVRVKTVVTNDVTFEGIITSSTTQYPTGTGAGSIRRITAWTNLSQLTADINVSGGDQQYADVTGLADKTQKQIPTRRSPVQTTLGVFDDPSLSWVPIVQAASDSAVATAVRFTYPNGSKSVGNAFWSIGDLPTINDSTLRNSISLSYVAKSTRYAT